MTGSALCVLISACSTSGDSSDWSKKNSPWDHIRNDQPAVVSQEPIPVEIEMMQAEQQQVEPVEVYVEQESVTVEPVVEASPADRVMQAPATYFTVQVMASVDPNRVYRFAEQNQLPIDYIVPTLRDGVTWHVLLLDIYSDRASALSAQAEAAATLRTQPWVRSVGSIQKIMQ
jgi:septal ring-binding cell division protein DamX